jgi:hypothetical protein
LLTNKIGYIIYPGIIKKGVIMTSNIRTQFTDQVSYGNLDEEALANLGAKAKLGPLDSIARFFYKNCCCSSGDAGLAKLGQKVLLKNPVASDSDIGLQVKPTKKKSKSIAIVAPPRAVKKHADVSPSRASTDSDTSRSPSPPHVRLPAVASTPLLQRLRDGQYQSMAEAIHSNRSVTVSVAPVKVVQPKGETIEKLRGFVEALSAQKPVVTVSHRIGENFQVYVDYVQKDGPMSGSSKRKTYLIPLEEIEQLGSSHTSVQMDLGAHLRAHLKANFSHIQIK